MSQGKFWCFTLNNPTVVLDEWPSDVKYCVYQGEIGDSGTYHFQGYIEFHSNKRLNFLKELIPGAHWEKRRGSAEEARDYAMKEDSRVEGPWEFGEWQPSRQGHRSDLDVACDLVRARGARAVAAEMPGVYARYHRGLHALEQALQQPPPDPDFVPRPWQKRLLDVLEAPADDRTIVWVKDTVGNQGKSRLGLYLQREKGAVQLKGRVADMAYMYNKEPIVVIDVPRTYADSMDHLYAFAEELKNGVVISTKYESCRKMFALPHVVFFANFAPDASKWSEDRLKMFDLQDPDLHLP